MKHWFIVLAACLLYGCSASIEDLPKKANNFDLFTYFKGDVKAWGMVQDYQGKMTRRFSVDIEGIVEGNKLTLNEDFIFDDGEKQTRIWTIMRKTQTTYSGTAADVVGEAYGEVRGNTLNWRYVLSMDVDGSNYHIDFDDWMFLQDEKRLFNKAILTKWGVEVGQVTLFFEKTITN